MSPTTRLSRKTPESMDELIFQFIRSMKHNNEMNRQRIFSAWNQASGAEKYTINKFVKDRVLYCTISSSMVRNQLFHQKEVILVKLNKILIQDRFFVADLIKEKNLGNDDKYNESSNNYIKSIVLR